MDEKTLNMMEEVIEKLQHIDEVYEDDIPEEYVDRIREIWCDMKTEVEIERGSDEEEIDPFEEHLRKERYLEDELYETNLDRKLGVL